MLNLKKKHFFYTSNIFSGRLQGNLNLLLGSYSRQFGFNKSLNTFYCKNTTIWANGLNKKKASFLTNFANIANYENICQNLKTYHFDELVFNELVF